MMNGHNVEMTNGHNIEMTNGHIGEMTNGHLGEMTNGHNVEMTNRHNVEKTKFQTDKLLNKVETNISSLKKYHNCNFSSIKILSLYYSLSTDPCFQKLTVMEKVFFHQRFLY